MLIGNMAADPELRHFPSGDAVLNFRLATQENYRDRSGEWKEHTEWHNVVATGRFAEGIAAYARKGTTVLIEGRSRTRKWEDNGVPRYMTEVHVDLWRPCPHPHAAARGYEGAQATAGHDSDRYADQHGHQTDYSSGPFRPTK
ncbi:single-stranded DNA-binding protein [Acidovorax sp. sic0104]|nr:single-stranded DNA-binding protein [Acidovorax sp. sic0104]